jgi:quercetin dioxygenase-like cupin family protein
MPFVDHRTIPEVLMRAGVRGKFLVNKDTPARNVTLLINEVDPGASIPLHRHSVEETVYMLEGEIWARIGNDRYTVTAHDSVLFPAGVPHAWGNAGAGVARMLWIFSGPDPFADSIYLEGQPPIERA